jgi:hypothetical protein
MNQIIHEPTAEDGRHDLSKIRWCDIDAARVTIQSFQILSKVSEEQSRILRRHYAHTIIITGFSISILNAPISSAPSAPSTAR